MSMSVGLRWLRIAALVCVCLTYQVELRSEERQSLSHIMLRFDGVYQSEKRNDSYRYLRFFDDGSVIAVTSTGTPDQIKAWFNRKHDGISHGTYVISGTRIVFASESNNGVVDYNGRFKREHIQFRTYSHINKHRGKYEYKFTKY